MKGYVNVEFERTLKEAIMALFTMISRHLPGETEKNHRNLSQDSRPPNGEHSTKDRGLYRSPGPGWPVVVRDDRLGTGQWQWVVGSSRRERERYIGRGCQVDAIQPLEGPR
jgi:prolyl oligopeptidase PreP (S9A serine peptidase family)